MIGFMRKFALLVVLLLSVHIGHAQNPVMRAKFEGFECGMGIGGWLTNYKRFNVLPENRRMDITIGDLEHFREYITEIDAQARKILSRRMLKIIRGKAK